MVVVCAWCQRYLGIKEPENDFSVTHSICRYCSARVKWNDSPTLVVSRSKAHMLPVLAGLLRGNPEIRLVLDRRSAPRRTAKSGKEFPRERRTGADRRKDASLLLS